VFCNEIRGDGADVQTNKEALENSLLKKVFNRPLFDENNHLSQNLLMKSLFN
jgi:hypothetical protein